MRRDAAFCGLLREPCLEVKLQSELENSRIAHRAGKNSERGRPEGRTGVDEIRMIENVKELRTERQAVFFRDGEFLAEIHVPILLEGPTDNVPAEIAEERAAGRAYNEGLIARAAQSVEAGNDRTTSQGWRGGQNAGIKYAGACVFLRRTRHHKAANVANEVWISRARRYAEKIGGAHRAGDRSGEARLKSG
jgi:hypothetical protein